MVMSRTSTSTLRLPITRSEPPADWRYAALGLQPTEDQEYIERAYWHQHRRYSALAQTDPEAMRRLNLVKAAYSSLCPSAAEPWTTRQATTRPSWQERRQERLFDVLLSFAVFLCLIGAAVLALSPAARVQFDGSMHQFSLAMQQLLTSFR